MIKKIILPFVASILLSFIPSLINAQAASSDFLRSTGKIYVVVAVVVVIFIGIILFLVRLDRKLTKIENQIK